MSARREPLLCSGPMHGGSARQHKHRLPRNGALSTALTGKQARFKSGIVFPRHSPRIGSPDQMDAPLTIRSALPSDSPQRAIFVGIAENAIVASCTLVVIPNLTRGAQPYGLIENVVTHASYRRRGYGKQLLRTAITSAWQVDCYKVMLLTARNARQPSRSTLRQGLSRTRPGSKFAAMRRTMGVIN